MSAYGFEIVQTLIVDIEPDEHVKRAMNEINAGTYSLSVSYIRDWLHRSIAKSEVIKPTVVESHKELFGSQLFTF